MGRRKIEIQPITHERNRAVTFLKRKNGLFKKAYELGVLCSVDVAVIIFEERPGHQLKLYQYCSGDANGIVQRHLQFDGERDTKTPHDFSGAKGDDADDDDEIEEEDSKPKKDKSSKNVAKPKDTSIQANGNAMIIPILPAQSETSMQADSSKSHRLPTPPETANTALPVSNDRVTSLHAGRAANTSKLASGINLPLPLPLDTRPTKRPRIDDHTVVPPAGLTFPYRLDVDLSTYPPAAHAISLPPPSQHTPQQPNGFNLPFPHNAMGLMGIQNPSIMAQAVPPFDLSGRPLSYPQLARGYGATLENLFGTRPASGPQSHATNMLLDLLSSGGGMNMNSAPQSGFPSFEWPVTSSPQQQSEAQNASSNENASWLEFFTSNTPPGGLGGLPTPTPTLANSTPSSKRHREGTSDSERSMSHS